MSMLEVLYPEGQVRQIDISAVDQTISTYTGKKIISFARLWDISVISHFGISSAIGFNSTTGEKVDPFAVCSGNWCH